MEIFRKGQISVYIVVASLIMILAVIYFIQAPSQSSRMMARPIPSQTEEFQDGSIFLKSCLDDAAEIVVGDFAITGSQALYKQTLLIGEIPRAVFSSPADVPSIDDAIETSRKSFETQLDNCLMDQEFPYDLIAEDATVDVSYSNGRLLFRTYPVIAKSGSISRTYDAFVNSVTYPLEEYLNDAKAAVEAIAQDPESINISALLSINAYHTIKQVDAETYDITLSADGWPGTSYSFIAKVR
ncbi:MAG: hypothetical protein AABX47_09990 [Nanoarchaeota archaeon]